MGVRRATVDCLRLQPSVALILVTAVIFSACGRGVGLGDRGHGIYFHNATTSTVVLYELGRGRPDVGVHRLVPDAVVGSSWAVPADADDKSTIRVEATSSEGTLIFCRIFGWKDLENVVWRIEITALNSCQ